MNMMMLDSFAEICYKPLGDSGEDAYAYDFTRSDIHAFGVFDGCGGSGAWKYPEFMNASGAFVAAQTVSKVFLDWVSGLSSENVADADLLSSQFHTVTQQALTRLKNSCAPMGVSGSLVKSFPCTASAALLAPAEKDNLLLSALNTGDSRTYVLTPLGLTQITRDDSRGRPDPLDSLRDNPPLSNLLNADKEYTVKVEQVLLSTPCAVICATDGIFGFVRSPMDFEYLLLHTLLESATLTEFEAKFKAAIIELTGDDSVCVMAFYGWGGFGKLQKSMNNRYLQMKKIIDSIDSASDAQEADTMIRQIWDSYKQDTVFYEKQV